MQEIRVHELHNVAALVDHADLARHGLLNAATATLFCNIADKVEATTSLQPTIVQVAQWVDESGPDLAQPVAELAGEFVAHLQMWTVAI